MPDDLAKTGKQDDIRININQDHEVSYWAKELDVTPEALRDAVRKAGPMVEDVRRALNL